MKRYSVALLLLCLAGILLTLPHAWAKNPAPLTLIQTIELPDVPSFAYAGELAVDLKGHRLFAAMQGAQTVVVVDINTGKVIHNIPVEYAHTVVYLSDLNQLYVTDQGRSQPGLKIFDARDYHLVKLVTLQLRADAADYDSESKYFYVDNGGTSTHDAVQDTLLAILGWRTVLLNILTKYHN